MCMCVCVYVCACACIRHQIIGSLSLTCLTVEGTGAPAVLGGAGGAVCRKWDRKIGRGRGGVGGGDIEGRQEGRGVINEDPYHDDWRHVGGTDILTGCTWNEV